MSSNADEVLVNGLFKKSIDDKYSIYTKDLKDLMSGLVGGEYNVTVGAVSGELNKNDMMVNGLSFYMCRVSSDVCIPIKNNKPISLSYHQMMDTKIRVISENDGLSAGIYFTSFNLTIDKKEM